MPAPRPENLRGRSTLAKLAAALGAKVNGSGFIARCLFPERHAHGDANWSMKVFEGRDGSGRLYCPVCGNGSTPELMREAKRRGLLGPNGKQSRAGPRIFCECHSAPLGAPNRTGLCLPGL